jgi:hypothetical protein
MNVQGTYRKRKAEETWCILMKISFVTKNTTFQTRYMSKEAYKSIKSESYIQKIALN